MPKSPPLPWWSKMTAGQIFMLCRHSGVYIGVAFNPNGWQRGAAVEWQCNIMSNNLVSAEGWGKTMLTAMRDAVGNATKAGVAWDRQGVRNAKAR